MPNEHASWCELGRPAIRAMLPRMLHKCASYLATQLWLHAAFGHLQEVCKPCVVVWGALLGRHAMMQNGLSACIHIHILCVHAGEYTQPGIPKPPTWHEVVDKSSGLLYYWCPETGESSGIGRSCIYWLKCPDCQSTPLNLDPDSVACVIALQVGAKER
eukprot:365725-Chlamydomonas_euryale.AAC.20